MTDRPANGLVDARASQRGVSLIIVMLILVVVTILGIGGARIALLGERSTRYDRDYLVASQAAEAALIDAEYDLADAMGSRNLQFNSANYGIFLEGGCGTGANRGLCKPAAANAKPVWATVDFMDTSAGSPTVPFGAFTGRTFVTGSGIAPERPPRYIIELVDDLTPGVEANGRAKLYRITAIGFGPRKEVQVVMQTTFRKALG